MWETTGDHQERFRVDDRLWGIREMVGGEGVRSPV